MVSEKVVTAEDKSLRDYEMVLVVSPNIDDAKFEATVENVGKFITSKGGVISETQKWGKKKLAYPIKHFLEGNYVLTRFKAKPLAIKELEINLKISEDVLRHLVVKLED